MVVITMATVPMEETTTVVTAVETVALLKATMAMVARMVLVVAIMATLPMEEAGTVATGVVTVVLPQATMAMLVSFLAVQIVESYL